MLSCVINKAAASDCTFIFFVSLDTPQHTLLAMPA